MPSTTPVTAFDQPWPSAEATAEIQSATDLDLNKLRAVAEVLSYEEWYFSVEYWPLVQVAAFSKTNADGSVVKLQVYPRTHAVSVCYFHAEDNDNDASQESNYPSLMKNQKTLYVVKDATRIDMVQEILEDPLGYGTQRDIAFTRRNTWLEPWTPSVVADAPHFDLTRRMNHVAVVSGLTTDSKDLEQITKVCQLFEDLLFGYGTPPCLAAARQACGSVCALTNLLLDIGREYHDVIGFVHKRYVNMRDEGDLESFENLYDETFGSCANEDAFVDDHSPALDQLKAELVLLPAKIRKELVDFLFDRSLCNRGLAMINSQEQILSTKETTFPMDFGHMDYSRLVYGEEAEAFTCFAHGNLYDCVVRVEGGGGDDDTAATEESIESDATGDTDATGESDGPKESEVIDELFQEDRYELAEID